MPDQINMDKIQEATTNVRRAVRELQRAVDHAYEIGLAVDLIEINAPSLGDPIDRPIYDVQVNMDVTKLGDRHE